MAIYNLDETPDVFITPEFYDDKFKYRMQQFKGEEERKTIRSIDLSRDKLIIYGCEIKESMLERLYESLILRPKMGVIYVNCDGACYVVVSGKGCYRTIHNVIFDWSRFGITIPNSANDSLGKRLAEKEKEILDMNHQLSSTGDELKASRKEVEELKEQLSTCEKNQQDMRAKLEKVCYQLSLIDFELEIYKLELESSKKEVTQLHDELSTCTEEIEDIVGKVKDQLSLANSELQVTTAELELSRKRTMELEEQVTTCKKESRNMEDQLCLINSELTNTKFQLESSNKTIQELEDQLASCRKECQDTKMELSSNKLEFEERLSITMKERQNMEVELQKMQEQVSSTKLELQTTRSQLESINSEVKYANQKLDHMLMSMLWSGLDRSFHLVSQPIRLQEPRYEDSLLPLMEFDTSICIPVTQEILIQ